MNTRKYIWNYSNLIDFKNPKPQKPIYIIHKHENVIIITEFYPRYHSTPISIHNLYRRQTLFYHYHLQAFFLGFTLLNVTI